MRVARLGGLTSAVVMPISSTSAGAEDEKGTSSPPEAARSRKDSHALLPRASRSHRTGKHDDIKTRAKVGHGVPFGGGRSRRGRAARAAPR